MSWIIPDSRYPIRAGRHMDKATELYFIAIVPPEEIREEVTKIKVQFAEQYQSVHALKSPPHITMIPPFRANKTREKPMIENLGRFSSIQKPFTIDLDGYGAFPPRVIFVHVQKNDLLDTLSMQLTRYLNQEMLHEIRAIPERAFNPHMSVAFRDLKRGQFTKAWEIFSRKKFHYTFPVDALTLLRHNGRHWDVIHKAPFSPE